jgi:hypothetical protein
MSKPFDIVFLFDVDNTLIDNDRVQADCHSACNFDPLSRGIGVQN